MGLWLKNQDGTISKAAGGGIDGKDGVDGKDGEKGDPGLNGSDGAQGPKGNTGSTGPRGPKGDTGNAGSNGSNGKDGEDGKDLTNGAYLPLTGGTVTGETTFEKSLYMDGEWIRISKNTGVFWSEYGTGLFSGDSQWVQTWAGSGILSNGGFAGYLHPVTTSSNTKDVRHDNTYGALVHVTSSAKYKEKIQTLTDTTDTGEVLDALRPVSFLAKAAPGKAETTLETKFREADVEFGFIAEEVGEVDAQTGSRLASYEVNEEGNNFDACSWNTGPMVSVLVAEVQQLRNRVSELEANNKV